LTATVKDKAGQALAGLDASLHFISPVSRKLDQTVAATAIADGVYSGAALLSHGRWDVEIDLKRGDERLFRSRNSLTVE
jgi:nitrogen fixation protein FixH